MKYFSMFSGIGGFELGISDKGECVGYSEIDKYAIQIYEKHFNHTNYGDATKIIPRQLPDFDLLVGGFPCQAFSIAGKRKGFNDTRGTLFFDIARILAEKRPRLVVLENVKGLLSHDRGKTFETILRVLTDLGYSVEWQVLNSKNFGVPQNRERVFIVGHFGGEGGRKIFPIGHSNKQNIKTFKKGDYTQTITTAHAHSTSTNMSYIKQINQPPHSKDRVYSIDGISPTLNTMQGGNTQPFIANTLDANYYKGNSATKKRHTPQTEVIQNMKIRRLTPTECERLQGFPDGWTEGISNTQRYKCLGNAVTVNVINYLFQIL